MKQFYSCIDAGFTTPSSIQHLAIREMAAKVGGKIAFYGSEEARTLKSQAFIRSRLNRLDGIDGICFFSLHQFRYRSELDWEVLRLILGKGLEIHFAREGFSLYSIEELEKKHFFLFSVDYTMRKDVSRKWLGPVIEHLGGESGRNQ